MLKKVTRLPLAHNLLKNQNRFLSAQNINSGISYYTAQCIAEDTFNDKIEPYKFMMGHMMEDYIHQRTKLPLKINIVEHTLLAPQTGFFSFLHSDSNVFKAVHADSAELYEIINNYKLNKFLLDFINMKINNSIQVRNLHITHSHRKINDAILWELDKERQKYEMRKRIDEKNSLCIGYINE